MIKIAISQCVTSGNNGANYRAWLRHFSSDVEIVELAEEPHRSRAANVLEHCHGLILPGGADIDPARYGTKDPTGLCSIQPELDHFEFPLVEKALELRMPILGICRGIQVINVAIGGTLIRDIPTEVAGSVVHATAATGDAHHAVEVTPGTILYKILGDTDFEVNSSHHQAVATLPEHLVAAAHSPADGVIEAIEWASPAEQASFLLGVQWHPERMDYSHPASARIAERFLFEAESFGLLFRQ